MPIEQRTKRRINNLLKDLQALCKKHSVKVWTCGCCGGLNFKNTKDGHFFVECVDASPTEASCLDYSSGEGVSICRLKPSSS